MHLLFIFAAKPHVFKMRTEGEKNEWLGTLLLAITKT
jgi:hypothetical protein